MPLLHQLKSGDLSPHTFGDVELTHCHHKPSTKTRAKKAKKKYEKAVKTHDALPKKGGGRRESAANLRELKKSMTESGEAHTALEGRRKATKKRKADAEKKRKSKATKSKATKGKATKGKATKGKATKGKRKPAKGKRKPAKKPAKKKTKAKRRTKK